MRQVTGELPPATAPNRQRRCKGLGRTLAAAAAVASRANHSDGGKVRWRPWGRRGSENQIQHHTVSGSGERNQRHPHNSNTHVHGGPRDTPVSSLDLSRRRRPAEKRHPPVYDTVPVALLTASFLVPAACICRLLVPNRAAVTNVQRHRKFVHSRLLEDRCFWQTCRHISK